MSNIMCRSPYWVTSTFLVEPSTVQSCKLSLSIGGTLRYTLIKNVTQFARFEIAELIRDYISWVYENQLSHVVSVQYTLDWHQDLDGQGTIDQTDTFTTDDRDWETVLHS